MNNNKWGIYVCILPLVLAGCISVPMGDGGKMKLSKSGVEIENEEGEKASITLENEEGGYTIHTGDTVAKVGVGATIPDDFPKEIKLPQNAELILSNETENEGKKTYMLSYNVEGDAKTEGEAFLQYLQSQGYEIETIQLGNDLVAYQGRATTHYLHYQMMASEEQSYQLTVMYGELE